ncbi:MAG: rRNA maturation RNase YbeY [Anaerolineales bacterium]
MTVQVHLRVDRGANPSGKAIERAAHATLSACQVEDGEITIVLTDDSTLRKLNADHRGLDQATDVLSFPMGEVDPDSGLPYLGDVVISIERAGQQASAEDHTLSSELILLTVHGVLHLLGYDHASPQGKQAMWRLQADLLESLGNDITGPAET